MEEQTENLPQSLLTIKSTGIREACGAYEIGYTSGTGTINLSVSRSISTTHNAAFGVTLKHINNSLGLSISDTHQVTASTSYTPPKGKRGVIEAYPSLRVINYDAYFLGGRINSGDVTYAVGVCFNKYY